MTGAPARWARRWIPGVLARVGKRVAAYPRFAAQWWSARRGYRRFGSRYPEPVLFIAGLPKSGTSWLKKMVASYPGYREVLIPEVTAWEMSRGGSHDYDLPRGGLSRFDRALVVIKMHVHASERNLEELREANVPQVVIFRDLRDVALSHYHYVRQTPWHPEYPAYRHLSMDEGLEHFRVTLLDEFADWIRSWIGHSESDRTLVIRYEELLQHPYAVFGGVARHFCLDDSPDVVRDIVDRHSFRRLSGGRRRGEEGAGSFFRKGVAGDWRNHFSPRMAELYDDQVGALLEILGYT